MTCNEQILDELSAIDRWSYLPDGPTASEPTAWAGLALFSAGRMKSAARALDWLVRVQNLDGSVGVTTTQKAPCWPTSLAIVCWSQADRSNERKCYRGCVDRAIAWLFSAEGETSPRKDHVGHDTTLVGWPWVAGTHSWLEPTALAVLALKATGHGDHPRTREAVRMLIDRQLAAGGCNYGNTRVLDQETLPHVQPTGLAMMALAGEKDASGRMERSLDYLEREVHLRTTTMSLCYGLMGLAAHDRKHPEHDALICSAYQRLCKRRPAPLKLALLSLAISHPHDSLSLIMRLIKNVGTHHVD